METIYHKINRIPISAIIFLLILVAILLCAKAVRAAEIEVAISPGFSSYKMEAIKPGNTIKAMLLSKEGFYGALEHEGLMLYGQGMSINSLSFGYRHQFKGLPVFVYGQGGYYKPDYEPYGFGAEAIYDAQARQYGYTGFSTMPWSDHYRLEFRPGFGAEVGIGVKKKISKSVSIDLSIGYRYLRMWADYDGLDAAGQQYWIMSRSDDFSAVKLLGGINYEF